MLSGQMGHSKSYIVDTVSSSRCRLGYIVKHPTVKGVGCKILSLLCLSFYKCYRYVSLFQEVLTDSLIIEGSDFIDI